MFCRQKYHHNHGFLFMLSLFVAFILGRKSEQYGISIISRGCGCYDDDEGEMDMTNDPNTSTSNYPR